jgi:hypothetical protein
MGLNSSVIGGMVFIVGNVLVGGGATAQQSWYTYCNARFGQCAEIPPRFKSNPPPENGDGLVFRDTDGMSITVSARNNALSSTLASERSELLNEKRSPTYQTAGPNWFVLSGSENDMIYYVRMIVTPDVIATLWIEYPIQRKDMYDPLISRISQSFKLLR